MKNTDFSISPEKEVYSADEEIKLVFSSITDFSYYTKYRFSISLEEFDENENRYVSSNSLTCIDTETTEKIEAFEYEKSNTSDNSAITKTFSIHATNQGKFICYIEGFGYHFNEYGGASPGIKYEKIIYFRVSE